jgi:hypothetical protein
MNDKLRVIIVILYMIMFIILLIVLIRYQENLLTNPCKLCEDKGWDCMKLGLKQNYVSEKWKLLNNSMSLQD